MKSLSLDRYRNRHPATLSGGEKRRLTIAGILAMSPEIILFDEPFANLDYPSACSLAAIVRNLKTSGKTIVMATHDLDHVLPLAHRIIVMEKGRIRAMGKVSDMAPRLGELGPEALVPCLPPPDQRTLSRRALNYSEIYIPMETVFEYRSGSSLAHRLDPRAKLPLICLFSLCAAQAGWTGSLLATVLLCSGLTFIEIRIQTLVKSLRFFLILLFLIVLTRALVIQGSALGRDPVVHSFDHGPCPGRACGPAFFQYDGGRNTLHCHHPPFGPQRRPAVGHRTDPFYPGKTAGHDFFPCPGIPAP